MSRIVITFEDKELSPLVNENEWRDIVYMIWLRRLSREAKLNRPPREYRFKVEVEK